MITLKLAMYKNEEKTSLEDVLRNGLSQIMDEVDCCLKCAECPRKRLCDDLALCVAFLEGRDDREGK